MTTAEVLHLSMILFSVGVGTGAFAALFPTPPEAPSLPFDWRETCRAVASRRPIAAASAEGVKRLDGVVRGGPSGATLSSSRSGRSCLGYQSGEDRLRRDDDARGVPFTLETEEGAVLVQVDRETRFALELDVPRRVARFAERFPDLKEEALLLDGDHVAVVGFVSRDPDGRHVIGGKDGTPLMVAHRTALTAAS